jgi:hypothetical protein
MKQTGKILWLEIISIRSSQDAHEMIRGAMFALKSGSGIRNAKEVRIFSNAIGDIALHIAWESKEVNSEGSFIGLQLAAALSEYGLINHTIWIEEV